MPSRKRPDCVFEFQISGAKRTTTRALHAARAAMVAEATRGVETRARKRKRDLDAQVGVAIPGLPFDVAVSLVEKHLPDPADLAVLRAVSKGMRDAVDATGRKIEEFDEEDAAERGY
jgi:orotate phosphoribosyltransferase-like protein